MGMKKAGNNASNFPNIGGVMVSKMVFDDNISPRFLFREKSINEQDSGWRIFTGFEPEGYTDDAGNFAFYNPSSVLDVDPSLWDILLKGVGSVYEKSEDGKQWNKVLDYDLEDDYTVTHRLTGQWTIDINNLFERIVEDTGDLLYTTGDKSVRLAIWQEEKSKNELQAEYQEVVNTRDQSEAKTLKTFDFSDDTIARVGYLIKEGDDEKEYNVLYGFTLADQETIQVALYFDDDVDLDWAVVTWKNIRK
jgi:hypothetical protein